MACPYFHPNNGGANCGAGGDVGDPFKLVCKEGYGRNVCAAFPADSLIDAVLITAARETAGMVVVRFSAERDYLPVAIGEHEYNVASGKWNPPVTDGNLEARMNAYVGELLQLKQEQI